MILSKVRDYLKQHGRVNMRDLTRRFDSDPEALRGMLARFVAKGRARKIDGMVACPTTGGDKGSCSSCSSGDPLQLEIYEWVEP